MTVALAVGWLCLDNVFLVGNHLPFSLQKGLGKNSHQQHFL